MSFRDRLNALLLVGPLSQTPNRRAISQKVMRGLAVENPDDAPVAISYAIWSERRYRWVAVLMGGLGALNIYISSNKSWTSVWLGVLLLLISGLYIYLIIHARRSIRLNEAFLP
jgi:hypothetical protein